MTLSEAVVSAAAGADGRDSGRELRERRGGGAVDRRPHGSLWFFVVDEVGRPAYISKKTQL